MRIALTDGENREETRENMGTMNREGHRRTRDLWRKAPCLFTTLSFESESRRRARCRRAAPGRDPPEIGGGSSRFGKKAGRSDVVTGVFRSAGMLPDAGTATGLREQSKPRAPISANDRRCGPDGSSASEPIPSGTTCSSAHGPSGITNSASVNTASRAACAKGTGAARPRAAVLSMEPRSHIR